MGKGSRCRMWIGYMLDLLLYPGYQYQMKVYYMDPRASKCKNLGGHGCIQCEGVDPRYRNVLMAGGAYNNPGVQKIC